MVCLKTVKEKFEEKKTTFYKAGLPSSMSIGLQVHQYESVDRRLIL